MILQKIYGSKKLDAFNVVKSFGLHNGKIKYDVKPMDLIDYNGEKCVNVMSFGLDTMVETMGRKIAGKAKFLGHQAYNIAVLPALMHLHYQINFEIDVADKDGDTFKWSLTPADYTLLQSAMQAITAADFAQLPIR